MVSNVSRVWKPDETLALVFEILLNTFLAPFIWGELSIKLQAFVFFLFYFSMMWRGCEWKYRLETTDGNGLRVYSTVVCLFFLYSLFRTINDQIKLLEQNGKYFCQPDEGKVFFRCYLFTKRKNFLKTSMSRMSRKDHLSDLIGHLTASLCFSKHLVQFSLL